MRLSFAGILFTSLVAAAIFSGAARAAEPAKTAPEKPRPLETSCIKCHSQLSDEYLEPTKHTADDVHFQRGFSCHDCHGGNPAAAPDDMDAAHDVKMGWKGKPARLSIPEFCGHCHADATFMKTVNPHARVDQLSEYRTSVHGQRNAAGDKGAAVCIDCHGVHGIRAISDPRSSVHPTQVADTCGRCHANVTKMGPYKIPTNQFAEYKTSVHAKALYDKGDTSAPTCNDCHGSHGAVPPGVSSVTSVCGSCHTREATLFRETEAKKKMDLSACIQCMVCHGNHAVVSPTDDMLGVGPRSTCIGCHVTGEPGYAGAAQMAESIGKLQGKLAQARGLLDRAERAGMEVSENRFELQKAQDGLVESRVLLHSFDLERFLVAANDGIKAADKGVGAGQHAFQELRVRRTGLALSLIVIAAVIGGLALKIRQIERRGAAG